jgi:hypothetical protein
VVGEFPLKMIWSLHTCAIRGGIYLELFFLMPLLEDGRSKGFAA